MKKHNRHSWQNHVMLLIERIQNGDKNREREASVHALRRTIKPAICKTNAGNLLKLFWRKLIVLVSFSGLQIKRPLEVHGHHIHTALSDTKSRENFRPEKFTARSFSFLSLHALTCTIVMEQNVLTDWTPIRNNTDTHRIPVWRYGFNLGFNLLLPRLSSSSHYL